MNFKQLGREVAVGSSNRKVLIEQMRRSDSSLGRICNTLWRRHSSEEYAIESVIICISSWNLHQSICIIKSITFSLYFIDYLNKYVTDFVIVLKNT